MKTIKIDCDTCKRDITYTGNSIDWRLAIHNEQVPSRGGSVTDMMIYPIFDSDYYFCSDRCFRDWVKLHYGLKESNA